VLTNQGGYYSPFAYVSEARRMGLRVLLPDVNRSRKAYWGRDKTIRVGLMQLKGLHETALEAILEERKRKPFASLEDFLCRVDADPADVKILIKAGAMDEIACGATRPEMIWKALAWHVARASRRPVARSLFQDAPLPAPPTPQYSSRTVLEHELETLVPDRPASVVPVLRPALKIKHIEAQIFPICRNGLWSAVVTGKVVT
jgi:error-prone DNA polymerase